MRSLSIAGTATRFEVTNCCAISGDAEVRIVSNLILRPHSLLVYSGHRHGARFRKSSHNDRPEGKAVKRGPSFPDSVFAEREAQYALLAADSACDLISHR